VEERVIVDKRLSYARQLPSPNCSERPADVAIELLVIHNISLPPGRFGQGHIEAFFCNQLESAADPYFEEIAHLQVSAHLLIDRQGEVTQFVPFDQKAWHAGQSLFKGRDNCNDFSIGIELEGTDSQDFTPDQYERLIQVSRALMAQYPLITLDSIVGHSDIAPGRKTDPGPHFDWARFRAACA
jgi:AmpD protein|tara:strand:- start:499 stop:1050 length:552 start_codon:yes stop_codon:yes gene_type:complete